MPRSRILSTPFLLLVGCPVPEFSHPEGPPRVVRFAATPGEATSGEAIEVSWEISGADEIDLFGVGAFHRSLPPLGSMTIVLESDPVDHVLEIEARNRAGVTRARTSVRVIERRPVSISRFDAVPLQARLGAPVEVAWETEHASRVVLRLGTGEIIDGDASKRGRRILRSDLDFSIEIRAEGHSGPAFARRTVRVRTDGPIIHRFQVTPEIVSPPRFALLEWHVERANDLLLTEIRSDGTSRTLFEGRVTAGAGSMLLDSAFGSRLLTIAASSPSGTVTDSTRLLVLPSADPEILEWSVSPSVTGPGGEILLRWATRFADAVELETGSTTPLPLTESGAMSYTAWASSDLVLRATRLPDGFARSAATHIDVDPNRPRLSVTASRDRVATGDTMTIAWSAERADLVSFATDSGRSILTTTTSSGTLVLSPTISESLAVHATNGFGTTSRSLAIAVAPRPTIEEWSGSGSLARIGRPVLCRWRTHDAIRGEIRSAVLPSALPLSGEIAAGRAEIVPQLAGDVSIVLRAEGTLFSSTAAFDLRVLAASSGAFEEEPNDDQATANGPYPGSMFAVRGVLDPGDRDFFAVRIPPRTRIRATTAPSSGCSFSVGVDAYEEDPITGLRGPLLSIPPDAGCAEIDPAELPASALLGGWIILALGRPVGLAPGIAVPYRLAVSFSPGTCGDGIVDRGEACDDGNGSSGDGCDTCLIEGLDDLEPNDRASDASPLSLDRPARGFLNDDDVDVYSLHIAADVSGPGSIALDPPSEGTACVVDTELGLSGPSGVEIDVRDADGLGCPRIEGIFLDAGPWLVTVAPGHGAVLPRRGEYRLRVSR